MKKKPTGAPPAGDDLLTPGKAALAAPAAPAALGAAGERLAAYVVGGVRWQVKRLDLAAAEFAGLAAAHLADWHAALCGVGSERGWLVCRRLFGVMPEAVDLGRSNPADFQVWDRAELARELGCQVKDLGGELEALRGVWQATQDRRGKLNAAELAQASAAAAAGADGGKPREWRETLDLGRVPPVLREFGFGYMQFRDQDEREWFAERVETFRKILEHDFAQGLGKQALELEKRIRGFNIVLEAMPIGCEAKAEFRDLLRLKSGLEGQYEGVVDKILEVCPFARQVSGGVTFHGVLTEVTKAYQEYMADGDRRLVDGMFTASDVQVLLRQHTHVKPPRYRLGLVMQVNAARAGLWDPHWTSPFTAADLGRLDRAFAAALEEARLLAGVELVDLEQDGAGGEYPEIYKLGSKPVAVAGAEAGTDQKRPHGDPKEKL